MDVSNVRGKVVDPSEDPLRGVTDAEIRALRRPSAGKKPLNHRESRRNPEEKLYLGDEPKPDI